MIVIGSTALKCFEINLPRTKASDIDLIATEAEFEQFYETHSERVKTRDMTRRGAVLHMKNRNHIEFEIAKPGSSAELLLGMNDGVSSPIIYMRQFTEGALEKTSSDGWMLKGCDVARPDLVYSLKMSHRFLRNSPHFKKTMDDILALRKLRYSIPDCLTEWMKLRQKETYYYNHPSLAQSKTNFFKDDNVNYKYDHDSLHEAVKTFSRPAFEYIKKDKAEVYCSKEKFQEANEAIRLATVLEESYVLALERHQIPNGFRPDPRRSFEIALMKVCSSISSGWWRNYAYDNYYDVLSLYGDHYVDRFHQALRAGIIKPYEKPENLVDMSMV